LARVALRSAAARLFPRPSCRDAVATASLGSPTRAQARPWSTNPLEPMSERAQLRGQWSGIGCVIADEAHDSEIEPAPPRESPPVGRPSPWAPLRSRIFLALFIAQLASNLGTLMQLVGSAWLMGDIGGSAALVALVPTASFLPVLIIGVPAGALADVFDRRKLLILTQAWMMLTALVLALLTFTDVVNEASLLGLTFALGLGGALGAPAWQAMQPDLVPRSQLSQAVALGAMSFNVGRAAGPALGGLIVAVAGPGWVFVFNALSFVGIIAVLAQWRPIEEDTKLPTETLSGATRAGLRYSFHSPLMRVVLVRVALLMLPVAAIQALLPIVVRGPLGMGPGGYGLLLACFGVGAALTAVVRPLLQTVVTVDQQVVLGSLIAAAVLLVQGFVHNAVVVGIALFAGGFAVSNAFTTLTVAAQSALPRWVRARGLALYTLVLAGGVAVGSAVWGGLADDGLERAHLAAAIVLVVGTVASVRWRLNWSMDLDLTPIPGDAPTVLLVPEATDGPVLVTVTYVVPQHDIERFANAMRAVEKHRRRTGAYRWGVFRDLAYPDEFVETFVVQSWAEHLRQHHRITVTSQAILEDVRSYARRDRAVGHYLSSSSPGALAPLEAHPELSEIADET
jgi:MFS family permease